MMKEKWSPLLNSSQSIWTIDDLRRRTVLSLSTLWWLHNVRPTSKSVRNRWRIPVLIGHESKNALKCSKALLFNLIEFEQVQKCITDKPPPLPTHTHTHKLATIECFLRSISSFLGLFCSPSFKFDCWTCRLFRSTVTTWFSLWLMCTPDRQHQKWKSFCKHLLGWVSGRTRTWITPPPRLFGSESHRNSVGNPIILPAYATTTVTTRSIMVIMVESGLSEHRGRWRKRCKNKQIQLTNEHDRTMRFQQVGTIWNEIRTNLDKNLNVQKNSYNKKQRRIDEGRRMEFKDNEIEIEGWPQSKFFRSIVLIDAIEQNIDHGKHVRRSLVQRAAVQFEIVWLNALICETNWRHEQVWETANSVTKKKNDFNIGRMLTSFSLVCLIRDAFNESNWNSK